MDAVDGNAIGGLLIDVFGTGMTATNSTCGTCRPVAGQNETGLRRAARICRSSWMPNEHAGNHTEGANMPHEKSMSLGTPDD
jgi:hypothetical protein